MESDTDTPYILYVPEVALEKIFSFLSYDEIAANRLVCRKFNMIGGKLLSRGFIQMEKRHAAIYKRVKSLLPRRESERRVHPLSRQSDILQAVETRISMLSMTYMRYIENNLLCFIPGKVLDEILMVLNLIETNITPPRTHQLLQELRDLSSMAMEHFDENILPRVREKMEDRRQSLFATYSSPLNVRQPKLIFVQQVLATELQKVKKECRNYKRNIFNLTKMSHKLFQKIKTQNNQLRVQCVKIRDQERKMQEQSNKIQEQEATLTDIKKHMDEWDQKYTDLTAELVRARDDILLKAAVPVTEKVSATAADHIDDSLPLTSLSPPIFFKSAIKPRMAKILPKVGGYGGSLRFDIERKRKSNLLPNIPVKLSRSFDSSLLSSSPSTSGGTTASSGTDDSSDRHSLRFQEQFLLELKEQYRTNNNNNNNRDSSLSLSSDRSNLISTSKMNLNSLIEKICKSPISSVKSRKRKMAEDIDLK